ncbi:hypothetical protein HS7_11920 [Sulfolobales archaeon HS-7]|nr:hypothetical protein HS7_11920 [Sulfolobales archaeon HS-7]
MVVIIISNRDPVGQKLIELGFDGHIVDEDPTELHYESDEPIVVISRHESSSKTPAFTVHFVGDASTELGIAEPVLGTSILRNLYGNPFGIKASFEATHHGPYKIKSPIVFAELGSTEREWNDEKAVKFLADSVVQAIGKGGDCKEFAVGFGGGHYAPVFTKMALKGYCFGHIISKYQIANLSYELVERTVKRNSVKITTGIIDNLNRGIRDSIGSYLSLLNVRTEVV